MIVHGIQVPRVKAASLAPLIGVQASLESLDHTQETGVHQALVRVGNQAQTIIATITKDMTIGYRVLTLSWSGILLQTVRVGRAIVIVS